VSINTDYQSNIITGYLGKSLCDMLASEDAFLAGGAITSLFTNQPINDWDIFCKDINTANRVFHKISNSKLWKQNFTTENAVSFELNENGVLRVKKQILGENKDESYVSPEIINESYGKTIINDGRKLQVILGFVGCIQEVLNYFDFHCCMAAYSFRTKEFTFDQHFFTDNATKTLRFNFECKNPFNTFFRIEKYKSRGYTMPTNESIKFMLALRNIKLDTIGDCVELFKYIPSVNIKKEIKDSLVGHSSKESYTEKMKKPIDINDIVGILNDLRALPTRIMYEQDVKENEVEAKAPEAPKPVKNVISISSSSKLFDEEFSVCIPTPKASVLSCNAGDPFDIDDSDMTELLKKLS
jgi:hypothetical protein